jgi:hypothetical protein
LKKHDLHHSAAEIQQLNVTTQIMVAILLTENGILQNNRCGDGSPLHRLPGWIGLGRYLFSGYLVT